MFLLGFLQLDGDNPIIIAVIVVVVVFLLILSILGMWKKVPQDKALVITGTKKRVISGGGGFVIPLLERSDAISLENMQINVSITGLTSTGVDISVGALTILKIKNEEEKILAAMEQFNTGNINNTIKNIIDTSKEVLEGKLREILSAMSVEELYRNREKFASSVQDVAAKELEDMGLEIKAFTIKEINDDNGYLESLGKRQVAEVKKDALIAESNAKKEMEITIAQNERETAIRKATLQKETAIQIAETRQEEDSARIEAEVKIENANKEKEIKVLSNREEVERKRAASDAAYGIEENKVKRDLIEASMQAELTRESKNVELVEAQMRVELTKKEQETIIAKQEAIRKQEQLFSEVQKTAEAEASKIRILAEADLFKREKEAEARKLELIKKSEAEAMDKQLRAKAESEAFLLQAQAKAGAREKEGTAEAAATSAVGLAKATAIEAEGLAEAKVVKEKAFAEAEAKEKLAEAYKKYGQAAMTEMIVKVLPDITKYMSEAVSAPLSKIGNITIIDSGGQEGAKGAAKISDYAVNVLTQVPEAVKATTGIDLVNILKSLSENINNNISDDTNKIE
ncbi:MAG: flotillin family protein [Clostridiales bacterium]|jgi:flotillin|nr:flotillin family protein [Clostridiales bacterium]